jgi:hypothetical protein
MSEDQSTADPLAALIIDGEQLDKDRIVNALSGIAGLTKSGGVVQLGGFSGLTARQKILAYLLAYKAADILGLRTRQSEGSADLARSIGLAEGTVYPTVSQLRGDRAISQDSESKCFLAHHQVASAADEVSAGGTGTPSSRPRRSDRKKGSGRGGRPKPATEATGTVHASSASDTTSGSGSSSATAPPRPARQKTPNGFKPSDAVRQMIDEGFFNQPRDLASVRTHLKDVLARDVPVTTLSPLFTRLLRTNDLHRRKNSDSKYEYFVPGSG